MTRWAGKVAEISDGKTENLVTRLKIFLCMNTPAQLLKLSDKIPVAFSKERLK